MAEIKWSAEAEKSLKEIYDYIATDNLAAASRVIDGIYEKVQILRSHPRIGQRFEMMIGREVREIIYGQYRIPYSVVNEELIEIIGVFHTARDVGRYLK